MNSYKNDEEYEHHVDTNIEDLIINFTNLNILKQTHKRTRLINRMTHKQTNSPTNLYIMSFKNTKIQELVLIYPPKTFVQHNVT